MSGTGLKHKDLSSSNCTDIINLFLYTHIFFNYPLLNAILINIFNNFSSVYEFMDIFLWI